jgi:hypothetical protein
MLTMLLNRLPSLIGLVAAPVLMGAVVYLKWQNIGLERELEKTTLELSIERQAFQAAYAEASEAYALLESRFRATEQRLQEQAAQARRERDAQVAAARLAADSLRDRLRVYTDAPIAAGDYSLAASAAATRPFAPGSVGALIRDQASGAAGRLIDEAERADTIRAALMQCYAVYDAARGKHGIVTDAH